MNALKTKAAQFLSENGFAQMAKDVKKCTTVKEIIDNVEAAAKYIYNTTNNPKKEEFKVATENFIKLASIFA